MPAFIPAVAAAAKGAAAKGTAVNIIGGVASSGASGGNQDTKDPFAGGVLSRLGGWTADPQTFFSLPSKIRAVKRGEEAEKLSMEVTRSQLEAQNLANTEEKRKQEWSRNFRKLMLRGGR